MHDLCAAASKISSRDTESYRGAGEALKSMIKDCNEVPTLPNRNYRPWVRRLTDFEQLKNLFGRHSARSDYFDSQKNKNIKNIFEIFNSIFCEIYFFVKFMEFVKVVAAFIFFPTASWRLYLTLTAHGGFATLDIVETSFV